MSEKQKLILKQKKKQQSEQKSDQKVKVTAEQKGRLIALQKQLQVLKLREILLLASFTGGAALLRVPMQAVPSAEPITFFAILAGWLFGRSKGFAVGATALYISNFLCFGGQGPWTLLQAIGFGVAGWLGGCMRKKASYVEVAAVAIIGTLVFEIIMNSFTPMMTGTSIFIAFALAIPFTLIHLFSNIAFAFALPKVKKMIERGGGFDEKDVALHVLNMYNIHIGSKRNWFQKFKRTKKK